MVGILQIESYFPDSLVNIKEMEEYHQLPEQFNAHFDNIGIDTIALTDESPGAINLVAKAVEKLQSKIGIEMIDIDVIIHIQSRSPDYLMSSEATCLQNLMGAKKALIVGITDLGCVSSTMALLMAKNFLIANNQMNNVLVTYGSRPFAKNRFRYPVTVIGDGGIAALITRNSKNSLIDVEIETNGKYWDLFRVAYKKEKFPYWKTDCRNYHEYSFELAIESKNRFESINKRLLEKHNLGYSDISYYMMQNISLGAYDFYQQIFDIEFDTVCKNNLRKYGHLGPMDVLLNIQHGLANDYFKAGQNVMVMNNSPVAAWGTLLLKT